MGFYNTEWDILPKKSSYDSIVVALTILIHLIIPIPTYLYRRREQRRDQEQQHQNPDLASNQFGVFSDKHFGDLLFNYCMMFAIFCGYVVVTFLNRYESKVWPGTLCPKTVWPKTVCPKTVWGAQS